MKKINLIFSLFVLISFQNCLFGAESSMESRGTKRSGDPLGDGGRYASRQRVCGSEATDEHDEYYESEQACRDAAEALLLFKLASSWDISFFSTLSSV